MDGYLTLGTGSDAQFREFCALLNIEHIAQNDKYKTNKDRVKNRKELIDYLEQILCKQTSKHWMSLFCKGSFPVGPVNSIKEVFEDEHIKDIELVKTLTHAKDGEIKVVGPPVVFSESQNDARMAPPILGQHTDEVLRDILGYTKEKIQNLRSKKIIE